MAEFGMVKSFDIDNGELDGKTPQECFVLGYELAMIDEKLKAGRAFSQTVHADNRSRIQKSLDDALVMYELDWCSDDNSESWMHLKVCDPYTGEWE